MSQPNGGTTGPVLSIRSLHNIGIALALDYKDLDGADRSFTEALKLAEATSNRTDLTGTSISR